MSLDTDPLNAARPSLPFDQDPPAFAQPTLPPPPVEPEPPVVASVRRRHSTVLAASLGALAAAALGGYAFFGSYDGADATAQASLPPPPTRPSDLFARIDRLVEDVPRQSLESPCTGAGGRVPIVLYASAEARRTNAAPRAIESAALSSATKLSEIDERLANATRIALVRTLDVTEPRASVGAPITGRYEAQLVVVDTSNGEALCHTRVVAWSSSQVDQPGIADRTLRDDFVARVRSAFSESGARLHLDLEL